MAAITVKQWGPIPADHERVTRVCPMCDQEHFLDVPRLGFDLWRIEHRHVQDAFPQLSGEDREFLLSGVCSDACWDRIYR